MKSLHLRYGRRVWTSLQKVIARGHPTEMVFSDWINLTLDAYLSLTENFARKGNNDPETLDGPYEERYAATATKYGREELLALVQAYLDLAVEIETQGGDALGELYKECVKDQPDTVPTSEQIRKRIKHLDLRSGMLVHDPCCGSGTLLLEAGKIADVELHGEDRDPLCARMCALNLVLFKCRGQVREGDAVRFVREWRIAKGQISEHVRPR